MIANVATTMTPILIAALGGLLSDQAGVLNIALEGMMLFGAFFGAVFAAASGSILVGVLLGAASGAVAGVVFTIAATELRANIFVVGLALNLLAVGIIPMLSLSIFGTKGVVQLAVPPVPTVGRLDALSILALAAVPLTWAILRRTTFGLRLRGVGRNEEALTVRGYRPAFYRRMAVILSGVAAGAGGAALSLRQGVYVPNITAGDGWIALVCIYLGNRHPVGVLVAALVFSIAEDIAVAAQGYLDIPPTLLLGLPYFLTVAAMIVYSAIRSRRTRA